MHPCETATQVAELPPDTLVHSLDRAAAGMPWRAALSFADPVLSHAQLHACAKALIERHRVTAWATGPAMLRDFLAAVEQRPVDLSSLRRLSGCCMPMPAGLAARARDEAVMAWPRIQPTQPRRHG